MTESVCSTMNVRSPKPRECRNMVYFRFTVDMYIVLDFFIVWCVCDWKKKCIVYLYAQTSQIDYFHHVHKILQRIGSSDFNQSYNVTSTSPTILMREIRVNNLQLFVYIIWMGSKSCKSVRVSMNTKIVTTRPF